MKPKKNFLYWLPRILCILVIAFISMFALDSFNPALSLGQQLLAFLIHMIPSLVLIILLIIAWKWELVGSIIFTLIGLGASPFIFIHNYNMNNSVLMSLGIIGVITFPFILIGVLFFINYKKHRKAL